MIRVVLDANIFVSAVLKASSNPGRIIDLARTGKVKLLISPDIITEVKTTLSYPRLKKLHRKSPQWIERFLRELLECAELTPGDMVINAIKNDPSDNIYLACAVEGGADFVISGDHHLKDLRSFEGIRIVDPTTFLSSISQ